MTIHEIDTASVHRITSGQVVAELASAVKELVENAIDANSTSIEVRFKNYGKDLIEVVDNGKGIEPEDFSRLGMLLYLFHCLLKLTLSPLGKKYHTSKLRSYKDLELVETFGFRGEALSSLCSLSDVALITNTKKNSSIATELKLDHTGNVHSQTICSGTKGTHVSISNLFHTLPVRRKDFVDNLKREFAKALGFLQAYAIVHTDVKMVVSNITGSNNKKSLLITTSGKGNMKSNIATVFGVQSVSSIIPFTISFEFDSKPITVTGFISKPVFGQGRSTSDRQFYYINSRPCVLPQFSKALNEVYKTYNSLQSPFVVANIKLDTKLYDVNVTPDKRTIFIHDEENIIEKIKQELVSHFDKTSYTIPQNTISINTQLNLDNSLLSQKTSVKRNDSPEDAQPTSKLVTRGPTSISPEFSRPVVYTEKSDISGKTLLPRKVTRTLTSYVSSAARSDHGLENQPLVVEKVDGSTLSKQQQIDLQEKLYEQDDTKHTDKRVCLDDSLSSLSEEKCTFDHGSLAAQCNCHSHNQHATHKNEKVADAPREKRTRTRSKSDQYTPSNIFKSRTCNFDVAVSVFTDKIDLVSEEMNNIAKIVESKTETELENSLAAEKLSKIKLSNINDDEYAAESTLDLSINKTDFLKMNIVGQFNKGFILVTNCNKKTKSKDLFIVDQHASDEIYNFEELNRNTVIRNQPLMAPLSLDLSAMDEISVISNITVFEKNGFKIDIDENEVPGKKCKLTSIPVSKSTSFGTEDLQELIYLLQTKSGQSDIRCSKVRSMFASRACRKSIMIGDSLTTNFMSNVVKNLSGLDRPWNCPHGRPTMRHLANIDQFSGTFQDCSSSSE